MIELLDFKLRGGREAPIAATRVARVTERYLTREGAHDAMAVVNEMFAGAPAGDPPPQTWGLEWPVMPAVVGVSVSAAERTWERGPIASNAPLRRSLPVTAALASRYGIESNHRT